MTICLECPSWLHPLYTLSRSIDREVLSPLYYPRISTLTVLSVARDAGREDVVGHWSMMRLRISWQVHRRRDQEPEMQDPLCNFRINGTSQSETPALTGTALERGLSTAWNANDFSD